ncbi:hypothetical protein JJL56_23940 [Azospirillum sp. YIM DDC1]|uniref:Uncharacterized protein n=1 Tax=Azospirillum aestuarii TaxID=2802052 RepID=A0ABS1I4Q5_9PROT|nr:hypothetical protein [Azospirillum aestuarii]MBK4721909.1 hypothetical protein [Azospirillum aestuarii]
MSKSKVAHINHQGVNLIIVPLDDSFEWKTPSEKDEIIGGLQFCASSAGLAGTVVPVWRTPSNKMAFIAPPNWHPFFKSIDLQFVYANINKELTCG